MKASSWLLEHARLLAIILTALSIPVLVAVQAETQKQEVFEEARIFIEYNASDNDLGFHVFVDGEDWNRLRMFNPNGRMTFSVKGRAGYQDLGLTELFFEGAEPSLLDVPLDELLSLFPEGTYRFVGETADGNFPDRPIDVVVYQIIVGSFQTTLPATDPPAPMKLTVPPELVESIEPGDHGFEVLAIDASGNQTITSGSFTK